MMAQQQILNRTTSAAEQPELAPAPTGAQMLIEALTFEGVETIFG